MNFHDIPQDCRDCILSYWSPLKEIKLQMEKYFLWKTAYWTMQLSFDPLMDCYEEELAHELEDLSGKLINLMSFSDRQMINHCKTVRQIRGDIMAYYY